MISGSRAQPRSFESKFAVVVHLRLSHTGLPTGILLCWIGGALVISICVIKRLSSRRGIWIRLMSQLRACGGILNHLTLYLDLRHLRIVPLMLAIILILPMNRHRSGRHPVRAIAVLRNRPRRWIVNLPGWRVLHFGRILAHN